MPFVLFVVKMFFHFVIQPGTVPLMQMPKCCKLIENIGDSVFSATLASADFAGMGIFMKTFVSLVILTSVFLLSACGGSIADAPPPPSALNPGNPVTLITPALPGSTDDPAVMPTSGDLLPPMVNWLANGTRIVWGFNTLLFDGEAYFTEMLRVNASGMRMMRSHSIEGVFEPIF